MLKWLEPVVPYIQDICLAVVVLLGAFILSYPVRKPGGGASGAASSGMEDEGGQSVGQCGAALLRYLALSASVLILSLTAILFVDGRSPDGWSVRHQAWLSFWGIYLLVRLAEGLFVESFRLFRGVVPLTRLSRGLLRLAIMLGVAFMIIKYQLGFNISVLLTSTAIVTGVIGFAMQGVLGNLLAGMSLHACRSMAVGDWVEVEGTVGQVVLVNWRETRLRTTGGHIVIVPNGKLAEQTIRNFSSPTSLRRHSVPVAASYGDAPGDVIAALVEAAKCSPDVLPHPAAKAQITGFKDFCIEYMLVFWSKTYERRLDVEGEVMRQIWYKFNRRGIEIPFPMSGRLLSTFLEAVHAQKFEMPTAREVRKAAVDLVRSDFGHKLLAGEDGECRLTADELLPLARDVARVKFTRGETIMNQGEAGNTFYVIVSGTVGGHIASATVGKDVQFSLSDGAVFGEMSLLTGLPRSATMKAETDCELLEFDQDCFAHLLSLDDDIPRHLAELAAARAAENADAFEKLKALAAVPPVLARDGILHRLTCMLGIWRRSAPAAKTD